GNLRTPTAKQSLTEERKALAPLKLAQEPSVALDPVFYAGAAHRVPGDRLQRRHDVDLQLLLQWLDRVDHAPVRAREIESIDLRSPRLQRMPPCPRTGGLKPGG